MKYWFKIHFNRDFHSYYINPCSFSSNEVVMKEEIQSWFMGLGFEEGFDRSEVPSTEVRKRWIDTHVIISVVSKEDMEKIFG